MGHRALVAYERDDDEYALHYSHWGAAGFGLACAITPATPFGCDDPTERVDPEPAATGVTLADATAEYLDFQLFEAFYVVDREERVTAYLPLWFGLDDESRTVEDSPAVGNGALVAVQGTDVEPTDPERVRGWCQGVKATLGALVDHRCLTEEEAVDLLAERVREQFHRREVRIVTPD